MNDLSPHEKLDRMITGSWVSQAVYAAAKFGIADLLKEGPRSVEQVAEATSTHPGALYRLLRASWKGSRCKTRNHWSEQ